MRRRTRLLLAPPMAVAVLVGGFVGYGAWTRSKPVHYARGGAFAPDAAASTAPDASVSPAPSAEPSVASAAPAATASAVASGASTARRAPAAANRARTLPAESTHRGLPVAGTYGVQVSGSEQVKFGPVSFCSRDFPSAGDWSVHHADGEDATVFALDQRYFPGQEGQHDERHLYRYDRDRVLLEFEQATVTCAGQRQSTDVTFRPAQLRIRGPLHVGDVWSSKGGDAQRTEEASTKVLREETLAVGGHAIPTYVVETHVQISGSESGARTQRWWWAPSLALPIRVFEEISAQRSGAQYTSNATTTVTSLPAGA